MGRKERGNTLQPTLIVHEAYLRLIQQRSGPIADRAYFLAAAAGTIRRLLVDHDRKRRAAKRGGEQLRVDLDPELLTTENREYRLFDINQALEKLARRDPRQARVVELRFFAGLTIAEVASVLEVSARSVDEDWAMARAWLKRELATER